MPGNSSGANPASSAWWCAATALPAPPRRACCSPSALATSTWSGSLASSRAQRATPIRTAPGLAAHTNLEARQGSLAEALRGADAFVGLSVANLVSAAMIRTMGARPTVLSLANPVPEIMPEEAAAGGAAVIATGRFDYPNQCNNVLAFPGLMRGALDAKALKIDHEACLAAARAIVADVPESALTPENILPTPLSATLYQAVAEAVAQSLASRGLARHRPAPGEVAAHTDRLRRVVAERQAFLERY